MSRAAEAREAVAAKRVKTEREERERTALKERREAIEAARRDQECWERRGRASTSSRPRHRTPGRENIKAISGNNGSTGGGVGGGARSSPSPSPRSPIPPESRRTSSAGHPGSGSRAAVTNDGGVGVGGGAGGEREGGAGKGRRGRGGVSGGVGYFELEQRISRKDGKGEAARTEEGERLSRSRQGSGSGITLKVYGDVWRWLGDEKVCSLREKVVEARFSLVHVTSVARKAEAIAQ
ncbi:unnamed protein product, partial [Hapterophycus canaliculatus]